MLKHLAEPVLSPIEEVQLLFKVAGLSLDRHSDVGGVMKS